MSPFGHGQDGIQVYQSTLPLNTTNPDSGLRFLKESAKSTSNFELGLSICGRFNYRTLRNGPMTFWIGNDNEIFYLRMRIGVNFLHFGGLSWLIKDVEKNSFDIWTPNMWHHICLAYGRKDKHIVFVKVGLSFMANSSNYLTEKRLSLGWKKDKYRFD